MKKVLLVAALAGAILVAFGSLKQDNQDKKNVKTEQKTERHSPCDKY